MKTPSPALFQLIHAMNPQEKLHFKRKYITKREGSYASLIFDKMNNGEQYDEQLLKSKLNNPILQKHLKRYKSNTYERIMESLLDFHNGASVTLKLHQYLQEIEILSSKRLFIHAKKVIAKAENVARNNECFQYQIILVEWNLTITALNSNVDEMDNLRERAALRHQELLKLHDNLMRYKFLLNELAILFLHEGDELAKKSTSRLHQFLRNPLLLSPQNALSNTAKEMRFAIIGNIFWGLKDLRKSAKFMLQSIELFERRPTLLPERINNYVRLSGFAMTMFARLNDSGELMKIKSKVEKFIFQLPAKLKSTSLYREYMVVMNNFIDYQVSVLDLNLAETASEEVKRMLDAHGGTQNEQVFYFNLFLVHFLNHENRKALQCLNKILATDKTGVRIDIILATKLINLLLHFELGNFDLLPSLCRSTKNFILKRRNLRKSELLVLEFFANRISRNPETSDQMLLFNELLVGFKKLDVRKKTEKLPDYFDWMSWIESKIQNVDFLEILKRKSSTIK